jgi:S-adenosylmethionine:tRNA-ribosyltransferase-isomerase (queuine synthetase)
MKPINIEKLMGHSIGISGSYYRATENELLEDYLKAIDSLTLNDSNVLKKQFVQLEEKRSQAMDELHLRISDKSRQIELLQKSDCTKDDAIAALSDKLQNLMEEVESLKRRK